MADVTNAQGEVPPTRVGGAAGAPGGPLAHGLGEDTGRGITFQPGIEGLRGLAVAAVLVFHAGFGWARGGFLGVSTFFTLSGFLITSLLLAERRARGASVSRGFWSRRFRRLLPASLLTLAGVVVFGWLVADAGQLAGSRGDVIAALARRGQLAVHHHRPVATPSCSADLHRCCTSGRLAIEEQFYLVFPLRGRGRPVAVQGLAPGAHRGPARRARWCRSPRACCSTRPTTRPACTTAPAAGPPSCSSAACSPWPSPVPRARCNRMSDPEWGAVGICALAISIILWNQVDQRDSWLYHGGLALVAIVSAALVGSAAAARPGANPALVAVGAPARRAVLRRLPVPLAHLPVAHPGAHRSVHLAAVRRPGGPHDHARRPLVPVPRDAGAPRP